MGRWDDGMMGGE